MRNSAYRAVKSVLGSRRFGGQSVLLGIAAFVAVGLLSVFSLAATKKHESLKTLHEADRAQLLAINASVNLAPAPRVLLAQPEPTDEQARIAESKAREVAPDENTPIHEEVSAGACNPVAKMSRTGVSYPVALRGDNTPLAPPANDECAGAITLVQGIGCTATAGTSVEATQTLAPSTCSGFTSAGANDVFFQFVATSTNPVITVTGTGGFDSVVELRTPGCPGAFVACADATVENGAEVINATGLTIGLTYIVRVYGWFATTPTGTFNICISTPTPPANDTCAGAIALALDTPTAGTNSLGANDYSLGGVLATCYTTDGEIGQTQSSLVGRDTVWSFTAPTAGLYSFRVTNAAAGGNLAMVLNTVCPAPGATACAATIKAANRNTGTAQFATEEIMCKSFAANEQRFLIVDEVAATTTGGNYTVEVNRCTRETEANNTPMTANALVCGIEGTISPGTAPRDVDFYSLGTPAAGSRVFAIADSVAGNSTDSDMRITNITDTLEYDDADNTTPWGSLAPNISGRPTTGSDTFIEMSHFTSGSSTEPYRLYAVVQPPGGGVGGSSATPESEPNDLTFEDADMAPNNFFSGTIPIGAPAGDFDLFAFGANAGDLITAGVDGDPLRDLTPTAFAIFLFDRNGAQLLGFSNGGTTSSNTVPVGLLGTTPFSPGEAVTWRARYSGTYYAATNTQSVAQVGDYLLSIGVNCLRGDQLSADVSIQKSGPAVAVANTNVAYTITVNNAGPNAATGVTFTDTFPTGATLVDLTGPAGWSCSLIAGGVTCTAQGLGANIPQVFTLTLHIPQCFGNGNATNSVSLSSLTTDPTSADHTASAVTAVTDPGTCDDADACTTGDTCVGNVCQGGAPPSCNDNDACTADSCNAGTGLCDNLPITCDDLNPCTDNSCNTGSGCVYTPNDANPCSDNSLCTSSDACVNGACVGTPVVCTSDGNVCTTEACNPGTGLCETSNNTGPCDDGNGCTTGDTCGPPPPPLTENFDANAAPTLPATWTTSVIGAGLPWVATAASSDTAPNSAFSAEGEAVSEAQLNSPQFNVTTASAQVSFRNRWSYETSGGFFYDGGVLEISYNNGPFNDIVGAGGSFVSGGYTGVISTCCSSPIGNRNAWAAQSAGYPAYLTTVVNLPLGAQGQLVQLRWRSASDSSVGGLGQNIDTFVLLDGANTCQPGTPNPVPGESAGVAAPSKTTYTWAATAGATAYDIVRGGLGFFPVGPGLGDESCLGPVATPTVSDATLPPGGTGFFYIIRAKNSCGAGTYGNQGVNGVPGALRVTTTCVP